jgi:hypothetical protein
VTGFRRRHNFTTTTRLLAELAHVVLVGSEDGDWPTLTQGDGRECRIDDILVSVQPCVPEPGDRLAGDALGHRLHVDA